jgi:aspartokinase-like uncharacterized kinase
VPISWAVKLGGSLAHAAELPRWLEALAGTDAVVVAGGGPFADQVRAAQARWRFGEDTAHALAILAMAQYGRMLAGLHPGFRTAADPVLLAASASAGHPAIWLPDPEALPETEIPASWDVTSDSLAAWLAGRLGAKRLLLVKSVEVPAGPIRVEQAVAAGWVDPAFPRFLTAGGFEAWLCGRADWEGLKAGLAHPEGRFGRLR